MTDQPELDDLLEVAEEETSESTIAEKLANSKVISSTKKSSSKSKDKSGDSKKRSEVKPDREEAAKPTVEAAAVITAKTGERINVVSLWPARLIERAGAVVKVHPADVAFLMSKNRAKGESGAKPDASGCCGGSGSRTYFDLA